MSDRVRFAVAALVALIVFGAAVVIRLRSGARTAPRDPHVTTGGPVFRGILRSAAIGLLVGHLLMIMWPDRLLSWTRDLQRLIAFEAGFFVCGLVTLLSLVVAVRRRAFGRVDSDRFVADAAFAWLLLLTMGSGAYTAIAHRWAAVWSLETVTRYAMSLLSLQPDVTPLESVPFAIRLHILASVVVVGLVGFTHRADGVLRFARWVSRDVFGPVVTLVISEWR